MCWRSIPMAATGASSRRGLRNCTAEAIEPATGALWCVVNERDGLGDDLPPDYATSVRQGAFYGWPWYYIGDHEDPRLKGQRPDLAGHVTLPDVLFQPHSAPLGITFYTGTSSRRVSRRCVRDVARFMEPRRNAPATRWSGCTSPMAEPTGEYEDFLTGFVASDRGGVGAPGRHRGGAGRVAAGQRGWQQYNLARRLSRRKPMSTTRVPKRKAPSSPAIAISYFGPYERYPLDAGRTDRPPRAVHDWPRISAARPTDGTG